MPACIAQCSPRVKSLCPIRGCSGLQLYGTTGTMNSFLRLLPSGGSDQVPSVWASCRHRSNPCIDTLAIFCYSRQIQRTLSASQYLIVNIKFRCSQTLGAKKYIRCHYCPIFNVCLLFVFSSLVFKKVRLNTTVYMRDVQQIKEKYIWNQYGIVGSERNSNFFIRL